MEELTLRKGAVPLKWNERPKEKKKKSSTTTRNVTERKQVIAKKLAPGSLSQKVVNDNKFSPLKEHLRHLFAIIISILQQNLGKKPFDIQHLQTSVILISLIFHLILYCIRRRNFYAIFEKL